MGRGGIAGVSDLAQASAVALALILGLDGDLLRIVRLSLGVSLTAVAVAGVVSLPLGAALAVYGFRGRRPVIVILNALMGLPPVVVGLVVYLLLSRSGPLGMLGLLFTPGAMVVAQAILVTPIVTVLVWRAVSEPWAAYGDALLVDGASRLRAIPELLAMSGAGLLTALLAGFGRAAAEVGAVIIVGGNIDGFTRPMTTAIALETSKGDLPLAIGLGMVLIGIVLMVNAFAWALRRAAERVAG